MLARMLENKDFTTEASPEIYTRILWCICNCLSAISNAHYVQTTTTPIYMWSGSNTK